ncbi:hypothetical protein [Vibrio ulleungensis]|uniref:1-pyrroline-5-carboxylate dehydrogenase n=1 Tax=Vibrio ulleungensis TaxID=2807619 RepID=A0ABS2HD79_9VIBR|nr:hypothetical protein [Vibrio ulleungensis]MBM7034954.1 hypothetical protein [Vibrio ulleungensis]
MNNTLIKTDAMSAFQTWYLVDIDARIELVAKSFLHHEVCDDVTMAKIRNDIEIFVSKTLPMPGPTGESNELYTQGRGVALIGDFTAHGDSLSVLVHVVIALMTGNTALVATDSEALSGRLNTVGLDFPQGVLQVVSIEEWMQLCDENIAVVTLVGEQAPTAETASLLAGNIGAITAIIEDTGHLDSSLLNDPRLSFRYITECTRTINVTAVGGNATLLELSH